MLGVCCFLELLELEHPYKTFCCIFLPGIGELEIFVKIVKTVEEIPKFSAQQSQHISVTRKIFVIDKFRLFLLTRIARQTLQRKIPFPRKTHLHCIQV